MMLIFINNIYGIIHLKGKNYITVFYIFLNIFVNILRNSVNYSSLNAFRTTINTGVIFSQFSQANVRNSMWIMSFVANFLSICYQPLAKYSGDGTTIFRCFDTPDFLQAYVLDHISNQNIGTKLSIYDINVKIQLHSQQWKQHTEKMSPYRLMKQVVIQETYWKAQKEMA